MQIIIADIAVPALLIGRFHITSGWESMIRMGLRMMVGWHLSPMAHHKKEVEE